MNHTQHNALVNFIWGIADDVLRDVYVRGKYRDVILPMTVLRRLDAVLEPTKQAVLDMKAALDREQITNQDDALRAASGQAFYNTSPFLLRDLKLVADAAVGANQEHRQVTVQDASENELRLIHTVRGVGYVLRENP
jgi:type I restriction enzyme M protein